MRFYTHTKAIELKMFLSPEGFIELSRIFLHILNILVL